jgi:DNA-binding transcriptional regulator YdaS (Cro superfamily)
METPEPHPLSVAASIVGSQQKLCDLIGVNKGRLSQWKLPGRKVPAEQCGPIERATGGRMDCETLRPDIDWGIYRTPQSQRRLRKIA